jgi:4'-phosphopantetheinyl transferase
LRVEAGAGEGLKTRLYADGYVDIAHAAFEVGDVHVWRFTTDRPASEVDQLRAFLSDGERRRAARFRFDDDRSRFIARRGLLRIVLARYMECDAARIAFELNAFGKPTLTNRGPLRVQFNASHSDGVALVAVTVDRAVGIDLERHRADVDYLGVAASFFSRDEMETLRRADKPMRSSMFYTLWSCKEAWVKARGLGLSFPLQRCRVEVGEGEPRLLEDPEQPGELARWALTRLDVGPEFSAALVTASEPGT